MWLERETVLEEVLVDRQEKWLQDHGLGAEASESEVEGLTVDCQVYRRIFIMLLLNSHYAPNE